MSNFSLCTFSADFEANPSENYAKKKVYVRNMYIHLFSAFNVEMVNKHRLNIQDLTKTEHDMYIMGTTMACMGCPTERNDGKERKKQRAKYRFWVNNS